MCVRARDTVCAGPPHQRRGHVRHVPPGHGEVARQAAARGHLPAPGMQRGGDHGGGSGVVRAGGAGQAHSNIPVQPLSAGKRTHGSGAPSTVTNNELRDAVLVMYTKRDVRQCT